MCPKFENTIMSLSSEYEIQKQIDHLSYKYFNGIDKKHPVHVP